MHPSCSVPAAIRVIVIAACVVAGWACATSSSAGESYDPVASQLSFARADHWDNAVLTLDDRKDLSGAIQVTAGRVRCRAHAQAEPEEIAVTRIRALRWLKPANATTSTADTRFASGKYDEALTLYEKALATAPGEPYIVSRIDAAKRRQVIARDILPRVAQAIETRSPRRFLDDAARVIVECELRTIDSLWRQYLPVAWAAEAGLATDADHQRWIASAAQVGVKLTWDPAAPQLLADAVAAAQSPTAKPRDVLALFDKALKAHAGFDDPAWFWLGKTQLAVGDKAKAAASLSRLGGEFRLRPEVSEVLVALGLKSPPLDVQLLTLTWIGGKGDQGIVRVGFNDDGSIYGRSAKGEMSVVYAPDGVACRGIQGDVNLPTDLDGLRSHSVKLTRRNPHDGRDWQVGYNQVHGILQQPYLRSPDGWKWWTWTHADCKPRELMADSRAIDVFFPAANRFVAWCWRDGGNSTITKDPRNLSAGNTWVHRGGGSSSYFMLGDAKTGEPLAGIAFAHRPPDACCDAFGRLYVAQVVEGGTRDVIGGEGDAGFTICDERLAAVAVGRLGVGQAKAIAVRGNLLVIGGQAGLESSTSRKHGSKPAVGSGGLKVRNPAQAKPGEGIDGFLAIVKLW